jgi:hypothetical protein
MFEKKVYIGDKVINGESSEGDGFVMVSFEDKTSETFGNEMFEAIKSNESCDASALRDKRVVFLAGKILELLLKYNMKLSEYEFLMMTIKGSLDENIRKSNEIVWGKMASEKTMLDIDNVLKEKSSGVLGAQISHN